MNGLSALLIGVVFLIIGRQLILPQIAMFQWGPELDEFEPAGYQKGNWSLWQFLKWVFMPAFLIYDRRNPNDLVLAGEDHLEEAIALWEKGYKMVFYINHVGSADVWMPQVILWIKGALNKKFRALVENFVYVIGLKFAHHPFFGWAIKCARRIWVVPGTLVPDIRDRPSARDKAARAAFTTQLKRIRAVNEPARDEISKQAGKGFCIFIAPEGTRQEDGVMGEPEESFLQLFNLEDPDWVFVGASLSKSRNIWQKGASVFTLRPFKPVTLSICRPLHIGSLVVQAEEISSQYQITKGRAAANLLMYALAEPKIRIGESAECGVFTQSWDERFPRREPAKEENRA